MNRNLLIGIIAVVILAAGGWFVLKDKFMPPEESVTLEQITIPADAPVIASTAPVVNIESSDSTAAGTAKAFIVTASNFKFDMPEIKVNKGDNVKITFKNSQGFHDFVIDEYNIKTKQGNGPSEEIVTFTADKAGTFEFYCSVGQHRAMGMKGNLIVQ